MDMICCTCDFIYWSAVLRLQQKSDPAKYRSSRILAIIYRNPVSGRKSVSLLLAILLVVSYMCSGFDQMLMTLEKAFN